MIEYWAATQQALASSLEYIFSIVLNEMFFPPFLNVNATTVESMAFPFDVPKCIITAPF